ncbi:MAG: VOC family protein [Gemmatimonadota bacterium]
MGKKKEKKRKDKSDKKAKKALKAAKKAAKVPPRGEKAAKAAKKSAKAAKTSARASKAAKPRRSPETLRLRTVMPSLVVNDLAKSLDFYRDGLGFVVVEEMKSDKGELQAVRLKAGRSFLLLAQDDFGLGHDRVKGQGLRLYCATKQPIDAVAERAKAQGVTIAQEPTDQPWGARDFGITDPDGFKLSIANWGEDE